MNFCHRGCARIFAAFFLFLAGAAAVPAVAADLSGEVRALRRELEELRRTDAEKQRRLEELEQKLRHLEQAAGSGEAARDPAAAALDEAVSGLPAAAAAQAAAPAGDLWSRPAGGARLRLIDLSLNTLLAGGSSTATNEQIRGGLQGGGHDPARRGFTLQQAELSLAGAVDPYFSGEAYIVGKTGGLELEEAFLTTSSLPYGLQLEAGYMLTEYGLMNPLHPHAWDWIDQPVIQTRLFGPEGLRSPGVRLGWLTPLPWFSELHLGVQDAHEGERTYSFLSEEPIGGRPETEVSTSSMGDLLYLARWENFHNLTPNLGLNAGLSGLHGPNGSGRKAGTWIYGGDLKLRWRPAENFRGWPFFLWQTEISRRDWRAARYEDAGDPANDLPAALLRDYGFYTQALYGFHYGWAAGARFEYASGSGQSAGGRQNDPFRGDRYRVSPLLVWHPTEFSRLRAQYNYDDARFLPGRHAHTVWIGGEILYGMHVAHKY